MQARRQQDIQFGETQYSHANIRELQSFTPQSQIVANCFIMILRQIISVDGSSCRSPNDSDFICLKGRKSFNYQSQTLPSCKEQVCISTIFPKIGLIWTLGVCYRPGVALAICIQVLSPHVIIVDVSLKDNQKYAPNSKGLCGGSLQSFGWISDSCE